jgi:hypothetical protein
MIDRDSLRNADIFIVSELIVNHKAEEEPVIIYVNQWHN